MDIKYDRAADALYICFSRDRSDRTASANISEGINFDYNEGKLIGMEILHASVLLPQKTLDDLIK